MKLPILVIDWGGTLLDNLLTQHGMLFGKEETTAVKGVVEAISSLSKNYKLVLATNATDSRSHQVRQTLARVGLDSFFSAVFTAAELGASKPDIRFFTAIQSVLGAQNSELLMIGDDYHVDILGAKNASWRAAWFNPRQIAAPGLLPMQDLDFIHWSELANHLETPQIPDYSQCMNWILSHPTSTNLLFHIHAVSTAAYQLALWLRSANYPVDPILSHRGGLLHDLAKIKALQLPLGHRIGHAELAALILNDFKQPVIAEIARRHPLFALNHTDASPTTWEEKIVYLADKLVEGAHITSLDERIASLRQRYKEDDSRILAMVPAIRALQEEICTAAGFASNELVPRLKASFHNT
jgi:putative hydrolase of the HAD superfamily